MYWYAILGFHVEEKLANVPTDLGLVEEKKSVSGKFSPETLSDRGDAVVERA